MATRTKILYVEDELALAQIVQETLRKQGFEVVHVADGAQVLAEFQQWQPDICVLDVMLPNVDGFQLGKSIRQVAPELPILFLTAKSETEDVLEGFRSGGRDYLRKPFSLDELLVRLENLLSLQPKLRRKKSGLQAVGMLQFDPQKLLLSGPNGTRKLTYREAEVLQAFILRGSDIIYKRELLLTIWGDDTLSNARSLDVYIRRLREYLAEDANLKILTLRGVGYRLVGKEV